MSKAILLVSLAALSFGFACSNSTSTVGQSNTGKQSTASEGKNANTPAKDGDYPARGKVTKINTELGSVELHHEEIKGVMAPMIMEFFVTDKAMLKGLKVGDDVDFTLRHVGRSETITQIKKR